MGMLGSTGYVARMDALASSAHGLNNEIYLRDVQDDPRGICRKFPIVNYGEALISGKL